MTAYLLIFGPVLAIGVLIGWGGRWWAQAWKASQPVRDLAAEVEHAADAIDIEWERIVRAIKEDGL